MKYCNSRSRLLRLPLSGPTGGSGLTAVDILVVEVSDNEGRVGLGFSYALGIGGNTACHAAQDLLARFVEGQVIKHPAALHRNLTGSLNRLGRGVHYLAIAAIDVAVWDLHAKRMGVPLGVAMGGEMREVPIYGSAGFRPKMESDAATEQALNYVQQGCSAIKLRMSAGASDEKLLRDVRDGLPAHIGIMVDANEKCDAVSAQWLMNVCAEYNVLWVEEPLNAHDISGYSRLKSQSRVTVATGEHLQGLGELQPFLERGLVGVAQPDLAMMGGITECLRVAQICEAFGVDIAPHFLPSLFIHLAAAAPNVTWLEDFTLIEPIFENALTIENGIIRPPSEPGHGLRLAPNAMDEFDLIPA